MALVISYQESVCGCYMVRRSWGWSVCCSGDFMIPAVGAEVFHDSWAEGRNQGVVDRETLAVPCPTSKSVHSFEAFSATLEVRLVQGRQREIVLILVRMAGRVSTPLRPEDPRSGSSDPSNQARARRGWCSFVVARVVGRNFWWSPSSISTSWLPIIKTELKTSTECTVGSSGEASILQSESYATGRSSTIGSVRIPLPRRLAFVPQTREPLIL